MERESELLLALLRWALAGGAAEVAPALPAEGWRELPWLIRKHGVAGYLAPLIGPLREWGVPPEFVEALNREAQAGRLRALRTSGELIRLLGRFEEAGVRVMPLKGPSLSQRLFGDLTRRSSVDIDLLVEEGALADAERLLRDGGYTPAAPLAELPPNHGRHQRRVEHEALFLPGRADGVAVDLHWRLFQDPALMPWSFDRLWRSAVDERFRSVTTRAFDRPLLTTYLCAHGTVSCWFKLKWLCDLHPLLDGLSEEEGERLMAVAESASAARCVLHGAALAERLLHTRIPESIRRRCSGGWRLSRDLRFLERSALEPEFSQEKRRPLARARQMLFKASFYGGVEALSVLMARGLVPVRHFALMPLPDRLFGLRFLLSPVVHGWALLRAVRRRGTGGKMG